MVSTSCQSLTSHVVSVSYKTKLNRPTEASCSCGLIVLATRGAFRGQWNVLGGHDDDELRVAVNGYGKGRLRRLRKVRFESLGITYSVYISYAMQQDRYVGE